MMQSCQITDIEGPHSGQRLAVDSSDAATRLHFNLKTHLLVSFIISVSVSLPSYSASAQTDSELKEINPAQAHYDTSKEQSSAPLAAPDRAGQALPSPNQFPSESMIPRFGQALPQVPDSPPAEGGSFVTNRSVGPSNQYNQSSISKRLSILEQTTFGATYEEHDPDSRLEHLEKELLGSAGKGNQDARLEYLENTVLGKSGFGAVVSDKPKTAEDMGEAPINRPQQILPSQNDTVGAGAKGPNVLSPVPIVNPVVEAIPFFPKAGDYISAIQSFNGGQLAHWTRFPIHIHLPPESPEGWQSNLLRGIQKWNQYIPLTTSSANDSADIEIVWVNHLVPKLLGITRLVIVSGRMHVEIFMLRPSFYPPQVAEKTLELAILHELGHAIGLYAHSDNSSDIMFPVETNDDSQVRTHHWAISQRDINTLRKVYQSANLSPNFTSQRPVEWGSALTAQQ